MENSEDNPIHDPAKYRFGVRESLGGGETDVEKNKREEEEQKKKRREQAEKRRREEQERAQEGTEEQSWFGGDKPAADKQPEGFLGALFGEEGQKESDKPEESPKPATEQSPESASAEAKQQASSETAEETPTDPEAEATEPIELEPSEKAEAASAYIQQRLEQLDESDEHAPSGQAEVVGDESSEAVQDNEELPDAPVKQFLQRLKDRLDEGDAAILESDQLDKLAAEVASVQSETAAQVAASVEMTDAYSDVDAEVDTEYGIDGLSYEDFDSAPIEADETDSPTPESDDDDVQSSTNSLHSAGSRSGGGSGSTPPPTTPPPPTGPPLGGGGQGDGPVISATPFETGPISPSSDEYSSVSLSPLTTEAVPNTVTREVTRGVRSGGEFLLGAFVGYFIGRRRGRNKAEAELAPKQKKIEKELRDVQSSIEQREQALIIAQRRAEQAEQSAQATEARHVSDEAQSISSRPEAVQPKPSSEVMPAKPVEREVTKEAPISPLSAENAAVEPVIEQRDVQEPEQAPRAPVPEILAASTLRSVVESVPEVPPKAERSEATSVEHTRELSPARIDSLPRNELLKRAQTIDFRGESLRQMYESGVVDEATVREVMRLEKRGQSYERLLMRRLAEHETARIGQSAEQILDPHPERHVTDPRSAQYELEAVGFANNPGGSENDSASRAILADGQSRDGASHASSVDGSAEQTSIAPQVAIGVALGIVFVVVLFWLFG